MDTAQRYADMGLKGGAAALKAVDEIRKLGPPLLALARRLPVEDAELIHRAINALPHQTAPSGT